MGRTFCHAIDQGRKRLEPITTFKYGYRYENGETKQLEVKDLNYVERTNERTNNFDEQRIDDKRKRKRVLASAASSYDKSSLALQNLITFLFPRKRNDHETRFTRNFVHWNERRI